MSEWGAPPTCVFSRSSAMGQARLEDVPHLAPRNGSLLPEGRKGALISFLMGKVGNQEGPPCLGGWAIVKMVFL